MLTYSRPAIIVCVALAALSCAREPGTLPMDRTFDGISTDLKSTQIVPTLGTEIENGHNAVWCASFLAVWKSLASDLAEGDISLDGAPPAAALLNKAEDPTPHTPTGSLYVATGWEHKGIIEKINKELRAAFPERLPPAFPGLAPQSFVTYAYLEANVKFSIPYFQSRTPMQFTDSSGAKTEVTSFGIRSQDEYAYGRLRAQPRVLFRQGEPFDADMEFAIDLCADSSPSQIVVARIKRESSLTAMLERIENEVAAAEALMKKDTGYASYLQTIGPNDILLVPDLFWRVSHRFSELEGKSFLNPKLQGQRLDVAQQDILFRLDRSGAELKSEAKTYALPIPTLYVLDRPFLIYMKKRGATAPYFAMWVDNGELLTPWTK